MIMQFKSNISFILNICLSSWNLLKRQNMLIFSIKGNKANLRFLYNTEVCSNTIPDDLTILKVECLIGCKWFYATCISSKTNINKKWFEVLDKSILLRNMQVKRSIFILLVHTFRDHEWKRKRTDVRYNTIHLCMILFTWPAK